MISIAMASRNQRKQMTHLIFAYGTLMRGFSRHFHLADQEFVGLARTQPLYRMVNCGTYPGLLHASPGNSLEGEIWRVSQACLARLDGAEGVEESLYSRQPIRLLPPYADESVDAYFYLRPTEGMADCGTRWTVVGT
jgi:gamma-glutamylcyclotransferase (GGCT)/AIG2-like uncharacterized protein YtfP